MSLTSWKSPGEFGEFVDAGGTGFIFKHSTRCPISAGARREVEDFAAARPEVPVHEVLVIEDRPASNEVARRLGIEHRSPQAILVRDGAPVWSASHRDITAAALEEAWAAKVVPGSKE